MEKSTELILVIFVAETKNQWARDDPAFVVLEMIFVGVCDLRMVLNLL